MHILFLTDTPARTERLTRSLNHLGTCLIIDVLDPDGCPSEIDPTDVRAVVTDVALARSEGIAGVRRYLDVVRVAKTPLLCLLQDASPRARAQTVALRATQVLSGNHLVERLALALNGTPLTETVRPAPTLKTGVAGAQACLTAMLDLGRAGEALEPAVVSAGAAYIENALRATDVRTWLEVVWQFDDATHQHCLLVAGLAAGFAQTLGLARSDCERLTQAALLHDVGKSQIPLAILNKPGRLDEAERQVMQTHPLVGYQMLRGHGYADEMLAVVRSHHEFLDGSGYPDKLEGRAIPDLVRLVTICDIYGALIERRPYKAPVEPARAYTILAGMEGKVDRELLRAFKPIAVSAGTADLRTSA
ncbi:HD-GYP domain-containing protein [Methylobacterium komagatae]